MSEIAEKIKELKNRVLNLTSEIHTAELNLAYFKAQKSDCEEQIKGQEQDLHIQESRHAKYS